MNTLSTSIILDPKNKTSECITFSIDNINNPFIISNTLTIDKKYTISFWVKTDDTVLNDIILNVIQEQTSDSESVTVTSINANHEWAKVETTFIAVSDTLKLKFSSSSILYLYEPKIELGNKATDWTPAPEDIEDNIRDTSDNLNDAVIKTITDYVSSIRTDADYISASVEELKNTVTNDINKLNSDLQTISSKVNLQLTAKDVNITIDNKLQNGIVTNVETSTGFKFDSNGLSISKSESPTNTQITEDGMTVNNTESGDSMLTANKDGVDAKNLRASTYLIVGGRSRFENYGTNRTGCFWIGE